MLPSALGLSNSQTLGQGYGVREEEQGEKTDQPHRGFARIVWKATRSTSHPDYHKEVRAGWI